MDRLCIGCQHFWLSFGTQDWSNETPGEEPSLGCLKHKHPSVDGIEDCGASWRDYLKHAVDCDSFDARVEEEEPVPLTMSICVERDCPELSLKIPGGYDTYCDKHSG